MCPALFLTCFGRQRLTKLGHSGAQVKQSDKKYQLDADGNIMNPHADQGGVTTSDSALGGTAGSSTASPPQVTLAESRAESAEAEDYRRLEASTSPEASPSPAVAPAAVASPFEKHAAQLKSALVGMETAPSDKDVLTYAAAFDYAAKVRRCGHAIYLDRSAR